MAGKKNISEKESEELLQILKARFEKNKNRIRVLNGHKFRKGWQVIVKN